MRNVAALFFAGLFFVLPATTRAEVDELNIPKGAGGLGFLPLLVMEKHALVEKHARADGLDKIKVTYVSLGGPAVVNDALISGAAHLAPAGPPAFLTTWSRTRDQMKIMGIAAMCRCRCISTPGPTTSGRSTRSARPTRSPSPP
jgi:NitT/TauT family transport system substrate-binding protein